MASSPVTEQLPAVLQDITRERARQISLGWKPDHDDRHNPTDMEWLARARLDSAANCRSIRDTTGERRRLIQAAALLVAAVEAHDRRTQKES